MIITVSLYTSSAFIGDWSRVHFISLANTSLFSSSQLYSTLLYCALKEKRLETKNIPINKHQGAMVTLSLSCFFLFFLFYFLIFNVCCADDDDNDDRDGDGSVFQRVARVVRLLAY